MANRSKLTACGTQNLVVIMFSFWCLVLVKRLVSEMSYNKPCST